MLDFEWDEDKARSNAAKHGVTFGHAKLAFSDPFAVSILDDREAYGEERFILIGVAQIGVADGPLLFVAYTERGECIRIISARRATPQERGIYDRQNQERRR